MKQFGIDEYGNKEGFTIICNKCGKEAWAVPTHSFEDDYRNPKMITFEFRCSCGNKYGATIYKA